VAVFLLHRERDPTMTSALRQRMLQDLQLAGLSDRTQDAYTRAVRQLADHFHTPPDRLTEPQLRDDFLHLKNDRHFAAASLGIAYSGIKFSYSHTCPRDWPTLKRLRVLREKRLPDVLSLGEARQLIAAVRTPHNRIDFQTVHSLGLRLTEGLHLQVGIPSLTPWTSPGDAAGRSGRAPGGT
jgi:integrase/recombinase XerD